MRFPILKQSVIIAILLLGLGATAYQSTASMMSRSMTGAPPDNGVWLVIGGLVAAITGLFGLANSDANQSDEKNSF